MRPRTKAFSATCVRGRSECHIIMDLLWSYTTTKGGTLDQGKEKKGKQISSKAGTSALNASQPTLWPH